MKLIVNGEERSVEVPPLKRLLDLLREDLRLTGTKEGCGEGECGACSVLIDGEIVNSCLVPVCQVEGASVTTVEGVPWGALQQAFLDHGGAQCGICTPGMVVGGTVVKAAQAMGRVLASYVSEVFSAEDVSCRGGVFYGGEKPLAPFAAVAKRYLAERGPLQCIEQYRHPPGMHWDDKTYRGDAYPAYGWAATAVEVEVDLDTYEVSLLEVVTATDVGRAIHPVLAEGQVEGGTVQALGYALLEEHAWSGGRLLNTRMQNYLIPTALDVPRMTTVLLENPYSSGPYGAKGLGELPMDGPAPAIVNAIENATGLPLVSIPVTPEALMQAMDTSNG